MIRKQIITEAQKLPQKASKEIAPVGLPDLRNKNTRAASVADTCAKKVVGL